LKTHSFNQRAIHRAVLATLSPFLALSASAQSYVEPGRLGDPASWRTPEFMKDWGLGAIRAEYAYALGFTGKGIVMGAVDSGYDPLNVQSPLSRFTPLRTPTSYGGYNPDPAYNDDIAHVGWHGTHVTGTMAAARDGLANGASPAQPNDMHGVAFNGQLVVGNTNGSDGLWFGPSLGGPPGDDLHNRHPNATAANFAAVYQGLVDAGVRVINNSWGSKPANENYNTLANLQQGYAGFYGSTTWLDAAVKAARPQANGTESPVVVFSAGNNGYANASIRASLPYFKPDLEGHWMGVAAVQQSGAGYSLPSFTNRCGVAKYSCVAAPGAAIVSTMPDNAYRSANGTSMAAPHASGALAVVMERYPYLTNEQALNVLFTTATKLDGSPQAAPDTLIGWGLINLENAMKGPGQLLGRFNVNMPANTRDEWKNGISDTALLQRQAEDVAEQQAWAQTLAAKGWQNGLPAGASQQDKTDYAVGMARAAAVAGGTFEGITYKPRAYEGSLEKSGGGTLVLSGANSWRGATLVSNGVLQAGAVNTFSPVSAHRVAARGVLDAAGFNQSLASLDNAGMVSLVGANPGTELRVTGAYVGQFGSVIRLGTRPLLNGGSDKLVLDGANASASGNTRLQITNLGGLGGLTSGNGIVVVDALNGAKSTAQTSKSAFVLAGDVPMAFDPHVDAGAYEYRLFAADANGSGESWYLRSELPGPLRSAIPPYRAEASLFAALPAQLRQMDASMLGSLHQRIGEDRVEVAGANGGGSSGERRAWGRVVSGDMQIRQAGTVMASSSGRFSGAQAGTDLWANPNWRVGVYVGQLEGDVDVNGLAHGAYGAAGSNGLRARFLGSYATYLHGNGFYADAVLQAGSYRYTVQPGLAASASGKGRGTTASVEVGQALPLSGGWSIEPQLQLIHQHLRMDDVMISGARVGQDTGGGWLARLGVRIKGSIATAAGTLQPYGKLSVYRGGSGSDIARFISPAASTDIASKTGHTSTELAGGFTLALNPATSVYGEIGKLFASGGDARVKSGVQGSLGVRMRW
jgi:subtilase-type serine protease